jgi:hypothetical protein
VHPFFLQLGNNRRRIFIGESLLNALFAGWSTNQGNSYTSRMQITTGIAHGTDVIYSHANTLRFAIPAKKQSPVLATLFQGPAQLPPFKLKFVQVNLACFEPKFSRLLVAWMTHKHIEQYAARIFADHTVGFVCERPLAVIT